MNERNRSETHHFHKLPGQLHDGNLTACSHVVDFSHNALLQNQQEGVDGVIDKQEMAGFREGSLDGAAAERSGRTPQQRLDLLGFVSLLMCCKQMLKLKVSQCKLSKIELKQTYHFLFFSKSVRNLGMT